MVIDGRLRPHTNLRCSRFTFFLTRDVNNRRAAWFYFLFLFFELAWAMAYKLQRKTPRRRLNYDPPRSWCEREI